MHSPTIITAAGRAWRTGLPLTALALLLALSACHKAPAPYTGGKVDKLTVIDQKVGSGVQAQVGMEVLVRYTGWLYDQHAADKHGVKFDSSADHGDTPFRFILGQGQVIPGWDKGVVGMRVGGHRELLIPARLGYGQRGAGGVIPPGAALVFDVQLVSAGPP